LPIRPEARVVRGGDFEVSTPSVGQGQHEPNRSSKSVAPYAPRPQGAKSEKRALPTDEERAEIPRWHDARLFGWPRHVK
jgi:hypothetical protein